MLAAVSEATSIKTQSPSSVGKVLDRGETGPGNTGTIMFPLQLQPHWLQAQVALAFLSLSFPGREKYRVQ